MDEKTKWEVEQLKERTSKHGKKIGELEIFKISTTEKMQTIFERLKEIETSSKWLSQSFFYLLGGGVISAVFSLIVWLIQK